MKKGFKNSKSTRHDYKLSRIAKNSITGITLVALVVTIVVLLILAGITLTYVFGDNSIFKQASNAKLETELVKIEERAQMIYSDKLLENASSSLNMKVETSQVIAQLESEGYPVKKRVVSEEDIKGISLDKESITMGKNKTTEIKVTYEGVEDLFIYYVEVQGKYYQMHSNKGFITIDREASNLTKADFEGGTEESATTLTVTSSPDDIVTVRLKENSNNIIEVISTEIKGDTVVTVTYGRHTQICEVKVKELVKATALEINSVRAGIAKDYTRWLKAVASPEEADQEFEWSSSDTEIATVDNKGIVTAKKAGKTIITVKTKDGSNLSKTCEVTIVENAPDVANLTDFQTKNTVAKDENGNLITVPGDFKVLTSEGTKVIEGIVIQDREGNEFVWVPVDSVSSGTSKPADDVRLGRYIFDKTTGKETLVQDAQDYASTDEKYIIDSIYQELEKSNNGGITAKNLGEFVTTTTNNHGFYFGRYQAVNGENGTVKIRPATKQYVGSQTQEVGKPCNYRTQSAALEKCQNLYNSTFLESDLMNSYAWDTAIVFVQTYSGINNYSIQKAGTNSYYICGSGGDKVVNIHDMKYGITTRSTENAIGFSQGSSRGGVSDTGGDSSISTPGRRTSYEPATWALGFRPIIYLKDV